MARVDNLTNFLTDVAGAIRTKTGSQETIQPSNYDVEIENIPTGIDTSDANATASDILSDKTAYVDGEKVTGNIPVKSFVPGFKIDSNSMMIAMNNYISASSKFPTTGYVNTDTTVVCEIDNAALAETIGLTADVIKAGVTILGIEGTYTGEETGE